MKPIKVSEASGAVLDWMVELALGTYWSPNGYFVHKFANGKTETFNRQPKHMYSTDPAQAYPIIEREEIEIRTAHTGGWMANRARTKGGFEVGPPH